MTADEPGFRELPREGEKGPLTSRPESGLSYNQSESSAGITRSTARHTVSPPGLIEMVKRDLAHQWEQGHQVSLETYLAAMPALGTSETVSPDLIMAEYRRGPDSVRCPISSSLRSDFLTRPKCCEN